MLIILEIQEETEGCTPNTITYTAQTMDEAKSKYHYILSYASVSNLYRHGAIIMKTDGRYIDHESYLHLGGEANGTD